MPQPFKLDVEKNPWENSIEFETFFARDIFYKYDLRRKMELYD